jgi:hypothetical protein
LGGLGGRAGGEQALPDQGDSEIGEIFGSAVTQVYGPRGAVTGTNESWQAGSISPGASPAREIPRVKLALNSHQSQPVAIDMGEGGRAIFVLAAELSPRGGSWGLGLR